MDEFECADSEFVSWDGMGMGMGMGMGCYEGNAL